MAFAINLHQIGDASVYTSCGNIPGESITIALAELNDSGQTGSATLTAANGQTQVALSATVGISDLNHIHTGTCEDLGGVAHGLTDLADGTSVTTVDATLDSLRAGGFTINLHQIGDASVYTSCGNIPGVSAAMTPIVTPPVTLTLAADQDNSIFDTASGATSNGAGQHLFAGSSNAAIAHRALVSFEVSSIPSGATVSSVELTLNMSRTTSGNVDVGLHPLTTDWGEGASDATGQEGRGADAMSGDATWMRAKFDTDSWQTPGGDFQAAASSTVAVGGLGQYTWQSTSQLVADVQGWVDGSSNFGWMVIAADESTKTAKRFDSKENPTEDNRPVLTVVYTTS